MPHVVVVEDEADILELIQYSFRKEKFEVSAFRSGEPAFDFLRRGSADLLILDIMLPGQDGLEICRRVRSDESLRSLPLIFLTARGDEVDRIIGLELGADDYVVKPFSVRELVARARAVLRRQSQADQIRDVISTGDIYINVSTQEVTVRGGDVKLSALEFRLLHWLASHPRRVYSREQLLDHVWGFDRSVTPRTVDVHIRRLREKIELKPEQPDYIETLRGSGYRFRAQAGAASH